MKNWKITFTAMTLAMLLMPIAFTLVIAKQNSTDRQDEGQQVSNQVSNIDQQVVEAIDILRNENLRLTQPDKLVTAIRLIKGQKNVLAIPELINLIEFDGKIPHESGFSYISGRLMKKVDYYPAARALVEIGRPSIPALINLMEDNETTSLKSENACYTLIEIIRNDAEAINLLKDACKAANGEKAARL